MKKIFASLTIFAAMLAGCQKPELDVPAGAEETFTATVEAFGALTKTSLTSNNQIAWSDGDRLAVFQASTLADEYKLIDGCDGLTNGSFRIVANNVTLNGDFSAGTEIPCNVALYPYYEDLTLSVAKTEDKKLYDISNVVLPQTQLYTENSFANGAFMMAAVTETFKDHNLKFKNVMGAVKLQFKGIKTVKTVKIEGNNNELLSGAAVVTVREDNLNPTVKMLQNASTEVLLDCGEGVVLNETKATEFIIALPPVKFEAGFTVTVTDSEGGVNTVTSNRTDNAVVRSGILVMPAMTLGEGTVVPEPEPEPESENWSLITAMDEWTEDIPLEYDGTFYYAKGLELEGYVKFRRDADWEVNFGSVTLDVGIELLPANDMIIPLVHNGMDIYLEKNTFDVYLDLENARAWFMTAGSVPTPVSYEWGIVGEFNAWGDLREDIPMLATDVEGLFVARAVDMPDSWFKIRANNDWEYHANYGLIGEGALVPDSFYVVKSGNTANMFLSAGTYDIWFDLFNAMVYVMSPGKDISDALFGEPVAPAPGPDPELPVVEGWGIVGDFNAWGGEADIMLVSDGTYLVAKGVDLSGQVKFRKDADWDTNFGASGEVGPVEITLNAETALIAYGCNFTIAEGTYDVYLDVTNAKAWFINDGSYPTGGTPIPDVPVLTGWGISGTNTNNFADGADIMMENDGTWYVAKGVEFVQDDRFKIRKNGSWEESFGFVEYGAEFKVNEEVTLTSENGYDMFPVAGIYDIYFNPETGKAWFINDGSYPIESDEPELEPEPADYMTLYFAPNEAWSANPTFAAWLWATDGEGAWYELIDSDSDGIYEVTFPKELNNIIFANMNGDVDWNNKVIQTSDLLVPTDGTNIYDAATASWYVLGGDAPEAPEVQPWYLVGNFNGWTTVDADYQLTKEGDWYVFKNFEADGAGVKFVAVADWSVNRGGTFVAVDTAIELSQNGADMIVAADKYDVYLSADATTAYFMTPGTTPSL